MRVPSRVPVLLLVLAVPVLGGCGDAKAPPADAAKAEGPPLRGLEARRNRAPAVLAAVEKAIGEETVVDLTFEKDRFTVLTSWVTSEQHAHPADDLDAAGEVPPPGAKAAVCRAVRRIDPGAIVFITGDDGMDRFGVCPQNQEKLP